MESVLESILPQTKETIVRDLEGKVALVTGGTKGIGAAISERLARRGATVVIHYFKSRNAAGRAVERLREIGSKDSFAIRFNMAKYEKYPKLFREIESRFDKLDIFISNAAMGLYSDMMGVKRKNWEVALDTNAYALLACTQLIAPIMPRGGRIIALSSLGSTRYIPGYASIGVAKAAIENLIKYISVELAPQGITANVVSGGFIDTDALKAFPSYEAMKRDAIARTPSGRLGTPDDLADVVDFIASEKSRWITGQTIIVDGGYSLM